MSRKLSKQEFKDNWFRVVNKLNESFIEAKLIFVHYTCTKERIWNSFSKNQT